MPARRATRAFRRFVIYVWRTHYNCARGVLAQAHYRRTKEKAMNQLEEFVLDEKNSRETIIHEVLKIIRALETEAQQKYYEHQKAAQQHFEDYRAHTKLWEEKVSLQNEILKRIAAAIEERNATIE
jgi:hypothetical protein